VSGVTLTEIETVNYIEVSGEDLVLRHVVTSIELTEEDTNTDIVQESINLY